MENLFFFGQREVYSGDIGSSVASHAAACQTPSLLPSTLSPLANHYNLCFVHYSVWLFVSSQSTPIPHCFMLGFFNIFFIYMCVCVCSLFLWLAFWFFPLLTKTAFKKKNWNKNHSCEQTAHSLLFYTTQIQCDCMPVETVTTKFTNNWLDHHLRVSLSLSLFASFRHLLLNTCRSNISQSSFMGCQLLFNTQIIK